MQSLLNSLPSTAPEPTETKGSWVASMAADAVLVALDDAVKELGVIDELAAQSLRQVLGSRLEGVIAGVMDGMSAPDIALQPIIHMEGGSVIGYEALARFGGGTSTADAFRSAAERGMHVEIELVALNAALDRLHELPETAFLGVNISADALADDRITSALLGANTPRLVVELTQQSQIDEVADVKNAFRNLQASGATICVDGAGVGFFTGSRVMELEPEIIKIARPLIDQCDVDEEVQYQVRDLVALGRRTGALMIALGVERPEQQDVLKRMGLDAAQGHLFGRPTTDRAGAAGGSRALLGL